MKKTVLFIFLIGSVLAGNAQKNNKSKESIKVKKNTNNFLVFDKLNYDFGQINEGEAVNHTFTFVNTGKVNASIKKVKSSWENITTQWIPGPFEPGTSSTLSLNFGTAGKTGIFNEKLVITDGTSDEYILTITGNVISPWAAIETADSFPKLVFNKNTLDLGRFDQGISTLANFEVTNTGLAPILITKIITDCECIQVNAPNDSIAVGKSVLINLQHNSTGKSGFFTYQLAMHSSEGKVYYVTVVGTMIPKEEETKTSN